LNIYPAKHTIISMMSDGRRGRRVPASLSADEVRQLEELRDPHFARA
jgi:hypothetical protein